MNSGKSAILLMKCKNYRDSGKVVVLIKPIIDDRNSTTSINSRVGIEEACNFVIENNDDIFEMICDSDIDCVMVDEVQFMTPDHIHQLKALSDIVDVHCYGLKTDYKSVLFPGSKRMMELADVINEIESICSHCNNKAIINAKIGSLGNIIKTGSSIPDIGGNEKYIAMCWSCWNRH